LMTCSPARKTHDMCVSRAMTSSAGNG
jgi:hypothetical protein